MSCVTTAKVHIIIYMYMLRRKPYYYYVIIFSPSAWYCCHFLKPHGRGAATTTAAAATGWSERGNYNILVRPNAKQTVLFFFFMFLYIFYAKRIRKVDYYFACIHKQYNVVYYNIHLLSATVTMCSVLCFFLWYDVVDVVVRGVWSAEKE